MCGVLPLSDMEERKSGVTKVIGDGETNPTSDL